MTAKRAARSVLLILPLFLHAACRKHDTPQHPDPASSAQSEPFRLPSPRCVYFKDLRAFLPKALPGFPRVADEGSTGQYGDVQVSEAKRTFSAGERQLSVRIVDSTLADEIGRAIKAAAHDASEVADGGPLSPILSSQAVGFIRFQPSPSNPDQLKSEATLIVGDRFVVAVSGLGFEGTDEVRKIARQLDLAGLSKLR